jgi:hypothetical protein
MTDRQEAVVNYFKPLSEHTRVYQKVSELSHDKINNKNHPLRSNTKGYGGETH